MKAVIAKIDFTLHGEKYTKGKEVKVNSKEELIRLNERGFIEPFSYAEIQDFITTMEEKKKENIEKDTQPQEENKKEKEGKK